MADVPTPHEEPILIDPPRPQGARGRLKIYLGMAAGVGKTYSMLADAQEAKRRGIDVVIGYLEDHGRAETEAMATGLERIPLNRHDHRGVTISEFDTDAATARRAGLTLIDELAHSNPEGFRHAKRWQDAVDLLDNGLDIATTVNIQHVASLRDVVAQITGVFVQETVPDAFFESADEIEIVDLPPDDLHRRLADGKVYRADKVPQALSGFFKRGNLLALRELALRYTAEKVDAELRQARTLSRSTEPWHASERILVCVAPNRMAQRVVRSARRIAHSLHADLLAVTVSSPRQGTNDERGAAEVEAAMLLAAELGARTATLAGDDIVAEVVRYAQQENVTTIVMGKPVRARWKEILFGSVVDYTVRASNDIDVLIITGEEEQGTPLIRRRRREVLRWQGFGEAILWIATVTWAAGFLGNEVRHANIIMLYLVGVVAVSLRHGRREALFTAIVSVAAFNFFFVPPLYTFAVSDLQNSLTFAVMLTVAILLSSLTLRLKEQSVQASERERNTSTLYELSRTLAGTRSKTQMATAACEKLESLIGIEAAVFRRETSSELSILAPSSTGFEQSEKEQALAAWVIDHSRAAGASTDTLAGSQALFLPLIGSSGSLGALGLNLGQGNVLGSQKRHVAEAIASLLATGLERAQFAKKSNEESLRAESERMRGDLLSSVSHDLRTPLASITGAASVLRDVPSLSGPQRDLAQTIVDESDRMSRLVRNLLDMTRVQGVVELNLDWNSLEDLVANAIQRTQPFFEHTVTRVGLTGLIVKVDGVLLEQVIVNLLENAARHGGRNVSCQVTGGQTGAIVWLEVSDNGPGIAVGDEVQIFERLKKSTSGGFGLGLAICKAAVEAHSGKIFVKETASGACIRIELPHLEVARA